MTLLACAAVFRYPFALFAGQRSTADILDKPKVQLARSGVNKKPGQAKEYAFDTYLGTLPGGILRQAMPFGQGDLMRCMLNKPKEQLALASAKDKVRELWSIGRQSGIECCIKW